MKFIPPALVTWVHMICSGRGQSGSHGLSVPLGNSLQWIQLLWPVQVSAGGLGKVFKMVFSGFPSWVWGVYRGPTQRPASWATGLGSHLLGVGTTPGYSAVSFCFTVFICFTEGKQVCEVEETKINPQA